MLGTKIWYFFIKPFLLPMFYKHQMNNLSRTDWLDITPSGKPYRVN